MIELLAQYVLVTCCRRYVFLEKGLEGKKQFYYNLASLAILFLTNQIAGVTVAQIFLFLLGGFNIALARKEHRIRGFFLIVPVAGIVNGLMLLILILPNAIFEFSEEIQQACAVMVNGSICLLGLLFYIMGKNWRQKYEEETRDRKLQKWESILLCVVGVLMMVFSNMIGFTSSFLILTCALCFVLSITIILLVVQGNKRSFYYERVGRMTLQMVHALANTIDAKDSYTNGHSTRVAEYSVMLAKKMGYKGEQLEQLQFAAALHDIGKIGVPVEIINKPGRLTDEEYEIIKTHPVIGGNILKEVTEIPDISIGARYHHERYDGKGYPDGLKGEEIPELARIIGVADAYDAMTSKRSYRDVLPQEVVRGEIEKGRGTQFDPKVADKMLELMDEDVDYHMHE